MSKQKTKYSVKRSGGYTFYFKFEPPENELLHIYVRHLTSEQDTITAFLSGFSAATYNLERERWETIGEKHTVFWFWLNEKEQKVMIITCFSN